MTTRPRAVPGAADEQPLDVPPPSAPPRNPGGPVTAAPAPVRPLRPAPDPEPTQGPPVQGGTEEEPDVLDPDPDGPVPKLVGEPGTWPKMTTRMPADLLLWLRIHALSKGTTVERIIAGEVNRYRARQIRRGRAASS